MNPFAMDASSGEKKLLFDKHRGDSNSSSSSSTTTPFYSSTPGYNVERVEYGSAAAAAAVLDKYDSSDRRITWYLTISVLAAMIYLFLLGYNTSVMNSPETVVFPGHSTFQWSLAVSSFAIGGPLGAVFGGGLADSRGRKGALLLNSYVFIAGGFIMTLAPNIYWLIPARFILGFASGLSSVVVPVYLGEISPPVYRGTIGSCSQFAIVLGILFSSIVAYPLATLILWRYLFALVPLLCSIPLILEPWIVESPRWQLTHDVNSREARQGIRRLSAYRNESQIVEEIGSILVAAEVHQATVEAQDPTSRQGGGGGSVRDLIAAREYRGLLVAAVGLQLAQQLCGINAVFYYSTSFLRGVVDDPQMGTCLVNLVNVLATYFALTIMDRSRRKHLLLISSVGMAISCVLLVVASIGYTTKTIALISVMLIVTFFEIGLGPIPWLIVAESFDAKYVASAMSLTCIVNWSCNFIVGLSFPHMQLALGPYVFAPFAAVLLVVTLFCHFFVIESFGRTVEEVFRIANPTTAEDADVSIN